MAIVFLIANPDLDEILILSSPDLFGQSAVLQPSHPELVEGWIAGINPAMTNMG
jgi:hypothetical protein